MEQREIYSFRTLFFFGTAVVLSHFAVVIWHLFLLLKLQPNTPGLALVLLVVVNLIPVMGMVAFRSGHPKLSGSMLVVPLGVALVIGIFAHFLSGGTDNVFRMPPGDWRLSFQITAVSLTVLEALGCWIGLRMFWSVGVKDES